MENSMTLSDFLNGYTSVSLYSRYSLSSHSVRVAQKNVICCTKNYVVSTKKNISHTKKYVVATKKIMWYQKKRLMLTKYA